MPRRHVLLFAFLALAIFALGWQLGMQVERQSSEAERLMFAERYALSGSGVTFREDPEKEVDLSLLWIVWRLLDKHYVDPPALAIDKLRYGAIRGLIEAVGDPYSAFMTPVESRDFQQVLHGTLEGIGAELTMREGRIVIVAPLKGSPAARAGLLPQDVLTAVDGVSLDGIDLGEAVQRIRGQKGTEVVIAVVRPATGEERTFTITREEIRVPSVEKEILKTESGALGLLTLNQFGDDTVSAARAALKEFKKADLAGMILDLRFNGGGYLEGAVEVTSLFLTRGKIVSVYRRGQTSEEEAETSFALGDPVLPGIPMVVLLNEGSASASEIVAGALQDHKRATLIGVKSFGKGTVQDVIDLPGGASLRVTVARWKTPNGRDLGKEGVVPDYVIERTPEDFAAERDPQKDAAVEFLLDGDLPSGKSPSTQS